MGRRLRCRPAVLVVSLAAATGVTLWITSVLQGPAEFMLFLPLSVCLVTVGALLGLRASRNPIGWLVLAWGVDVSFCMTITLWGARTVREHGEPGAVQRWLSLAVPVLWHPGFVLFIVALLVFPHGRLLSRRWRPVLAVVVAFCVALSVSAALSPSGSMGDYVPGIRAPFASPAEHAASIAFGILLTCMLPTVLLAASTLVLRWRRSAGDDRRQITAFALPTAVALTLFVLSIVVIGDGRLGVILLAVLPISLAVAITRYRLYALDRIVSRTVTYSVVTAVVIGVYAGAVQLITLALPGADALGVAAATLTAAALFTPLRRRVQHRVDRRFNRTRYDHEHTIEQLRTHLRRDVELTQVQRDLVDSVDHALHPASTSVWLRPA